MGYDGFISYSHAADGRLAPALQRGLQRLAKKWNSRRALHVFRDETGLSTNPHLWSAIETALDDSDWFVLLASPESAASEWVNKEVAHWVATKPVDHILPVVTDGTWEWDASANDFTAASTAVPPALRGVLRDEARHLDLRWARNETDLDLRNSRFRAAIADLAAPMHGIAKDDLEGEDIRQQKRARRLARGGVATLAILLVVALIATAVAVNKSNQANRERNQADSARRLAEASAAEALTRGLAAEDASLLQSGRGDEALLVAVEAQETAERARIGGPAAQEAHDALLRAITADPKLARFFADQPGTPIVVKYSPDGARIVSANLDNDVRVWDARTGRELPHPPPVPRGKTLLPDFALNRHGLLARAEPSGVSLWDVNTNAAASWQPPRHAPLQVQGLGTAFVAVTDGGLVAEAYGSTTTTLNVWDVTRERRVGVESTFAGQPQAVAFSPDGSQLAVLALNGTSSLSVQLIDTTTGKAGPRLDAQHGAFDPILAPFNSAVVFSADGSQVSSVASHGPGVIASGFSLTNESAIATFDVQTGARIPRPAVGVGDEVVAVSPDLREIAVQTGNTASSPLVVLDTRTGAQLSETPLATSGYNSAFAFDPTRPYIAGALGPGALSVIDWTQPGAPHFAQSSIGPASAEVFGLAADAHAIDLTEALRTLGLPTRCFAPITSDCDYRVDQPTTPPEAQQIPFALDSSRKPWSATASASGQVAILDGKQIVIWNPAGNRVERRLTGVPAKCDDFAPHDLALVGTAREGRVVFGCPPSLLSWDLSSSASTPAWRYAWAGPSFNAPTPVLISNDDTTVGVTAFGGMQFVDARTGRLRAHGPTVEEDIQTGGAFSPDGHTYAQVAFSGAVTLIDIATGKVRRTLNSALGDLSDAGVTCGICGATSGNPPSVAYSPDGQLIAVWHDAVGIEIWNAQTGAEIAVLGGTTPDPAGTLNTLAGTGTFDVAFRHRLVAAFPSGDTLQVADVRELVSVVAGAPTNNYTSRLRTVTWSMRPADWELAACSVVRRDLTRAEWKSLVSSTAPYEHTCTPLLTKASPHG